MVQFGIWRSHKYGSFLVSVGEDNTLVVWNLPRILKLDLLEYGCNWVRDFLRTNAEVEEGDRQRESIVIRHRAF